MKWLMAAFVLACAVCITGCQSLIYHVIGAVTPQDVKAEMFHQRMAEARTPIIVLQCRVTTYRDRERSFVADEDAGWTRACGILSNLTAHGQGGNRPVDAMAVVILSSGASNRVFRVPATTVPVYIVSSRPVGGGIPIRDALASNLLALASVSGHGNFPFEKSHIDVDRRDPINEIVIPREREKSDKRWITVKELNDSTRARYLQTVTVGWPRLIPPQSQDSDVLCLSWEEYHIASRDQWKQRLRHMPVEIAGAAAQGAMNAVFQVQPIYRPSRWQPDRNHTIFTCARVSTESNAVYYWKWYSYNSVGEVERVSREVTRMSRLANHSPGK